MRWSRWMILKVVLCSCVIMAVILTFMERTLPQTIDDGTVIGLRQRDTGNFKRGQKETYLRSQDKTDDRKIMYENFSWIFPDATETHDRIFEQMNLKVPLKQNKTILLWRKSFFQHQDGNSIFIDGQCPMTNCYITHNRTKVNESNAILFDLFVLEERFPNLKHVDLRSKVIALYLLESPSHTTAFKDLNGIVNWTASYRQDSVIVTPYAHYTPSQSNRIPPRRPYRNYLAGKSKMVAWFVSNCKSHNGREAYAIELGKFIQVDIYGECGRLTCEKENENCLQMLDKDYKFYLAFENSNCKDYISEKFFSMGLERDVIPIVMGAHPDDYARVAPPHSYIHVDDFASPQDLANYLHTLDADNELYNAYFDWKGSYESINTKMWCRLCAMLQLAPDYPMWYRDLDTWWGGEGLCQIPGKKTWATWQNVTPPNPKSFAKAVRHEFPRTD